MDASGTRSPATRHTTGLLAATSRKKQNLMCGGVSDEHKQTKNSTLK